MTVSTTESTPRRTPSRWPVRWPSRTPWSRPTRSCSSRSCCSRSASPRTSSATSSGTSTPAVGRPLGMEAKGSATEIKAEVPMAEVLDYARDLRQITGGRGDYTMEFARHEEIPSHLAQKVISEARSEEEVRATEGRRQRRRGVAGTRDRRGSPPSPRTGRRGARRAQRDDRPGDQQRRRVPGAPARHRACEGARCR